jgi:flagellar biosynthetic protein FliR
MTPPLIPPEELAAFLLILIRVSAILFLAPIFGGDLVPSQVKAALALVLTFVLVGVVPVPANALPEDVFGVVQLLVSELFLALTLGLILRLLLEAVQLAGQYIGYDMGFAIVNVVNPQTGTQASVMSQFVYILALVVFLSVNGHYLVIQALVQSFELVPPGRPIHSALAFHEMNQAVTRMFVIAVQLGAPVMVVMFAVKAAMGILAKTVPQLNVLFVGMPLYIIVGAILMGLSLNFFVPLFSRALLGYQGHLFESLKTM